MHAPQPASAVGQGLGARLHRRRSLNIVGFSLIGTFAQLTAATSRVTILAYTMPVWSVLLAWPVLGERPNRMQVGGARFCAAGLAILVYPLAAQRPSARAIVLAALTGFSWAAGTVYLKWARIEADPMGVASWQMTDRLRVIMTALMFVFEGHPDLSRARMGRLARHDLDRHRRQRRLPMRCGFRWCGGCSHVTASVGVLGVPVIGVVSAFLILGEVPTAPDMSALL